MSKKETKNKPHLDEIIQELSNLAQDLARGKIHIGAHTVTVGSPDSFKLKQKLKGQHISYELSFQVPVVGEASVGPGSQSVPAADIQKPAAAPRPSREPAPAKPRGMKPKKEMAGLWKNISQKIAAQTAPPPEEARRLLDLSALSMYSGEVFHGDWLACCMAVQECLEAAEKGDFTRAGQLVATVKEMKRSCHKQFK